MIIPFDRFTDINALMITAGFGKLALFKDVPEQHIIDSFNVNTIPVLRLIKRFYNRLEDKENDFYCGVMIVYPVGCPLLSLLYMGQLRH